MTPKDVLKIITITALTFPLMTTVAVAGMGVAMVMALVFGPILSPILLVISVRDHLKEGK